MTIQPAIDAGEDDWLTDKAFRRIAAIAHAEAGLDIPSAKRSMVQSRLKRHMRDMGWNHVDALFEALDRDPCARDGLISVLTTNVSSFFRESHHFESLRDTVLPPLIEAARRGARLRIWSAGCSSGQEPYSLAMQILMLAPDAGRLDLRILATDIDHRILDFAIAATYSEREVAGLPAACRSAFVAATGDGRWRVTEDVRSLVRFRRLNLVGDWPMRRPFDIIFCRNVVIYFDQATQSQLWQRFKHQLTPGGWLFVGHSERVAEAGRLGFAGRGITAYQLQPGTT